MACVLTPTARGSSPRRIEQNRHRTKPLE